MSHWWSAQRLGLGGDDVRVVLLIGLRRRLPAPYLHLSGGYQRIGRPAPLLDLLTGFAQDMGATPAQSSLACMLHEGGRLNSAPTSASRSPARTNRGLMSRGPVV